MALDPPLLFGELAGFKDQRLAGDLSCRAGGRRERSPGVPTSLGRKPLAPAEPWNELVVLSAPDLATLKVDAAVRRGMLRDLCDLHLLCLSGADLEAAVRASGIDLVTALKTLTDGERFRGQPELQLRRVWSTEEALACFTARPGAF